MPKSTGIYTSAGNLRQIRVPIKTDHLRDVEFNSLQTYAPAKNLKKDKPLSTFAYFNYNRGRRLAVVKSPLGNIGDLLYSAEAWKYHFFGKHGINAPGIRYESDGEMRWKVDAKSITDKEYRSPITMPKKYARYWYKITNLTVGMVQDATEKDVIALGIKREFCAETVPETGEDVSGWGYYICDENAPRFDTLEYGSPIDALKADWNAKHPDFPFESNPWSWIAELERIDK